MFDMKKFAAFLTDRRKARELTQVQLADAVGVTPQAVSKWERSEAIPEISKIADLGEALGVTAADVLASMYSETAKEPESSVELSSQPVSAADREYYSLEDRASIADIYYLAPDLSPDTLFEALKECVLRHGAEKSSILFGFADEALLARLTDTLVNYCAVPDIRPLYPYMSQRAVCRRLLSAASGNDSELEKAIPLMPYCKDEKILKMFFDSVVGRFRTWNPLADIVGKLPDSVTVPEGIAYAVERNLTSFNGWQGRITPRALTRICLGYASHFNDNPLSWQHVSVFASSLDMSLAEPEILARAARCGAENFRRLAPRLSPEAQRKLFGSQPPVITAQTGARLPDDVIEEIEGHIEELEERIEELEGRIDELESQTDELS